MVVAVIIIISLILAIIFLRRYRLSKLPEFLRGKSVSKYKDIITERDVYIASSKEKVTKKYITQAYFVDDHTICRRAIFKQPYGYMLYEDGKLSVVPKGYVISLLERIKKEKANDNITDNTDENKQ